MYETHSEYNIINLQKIKVKLTFIMADIIANTKTVLVLRPDKRVLLFNPASSRWQC